MSAMEYCITIKREKIFMNTDEMTFKIILTENSKVQKDICNILSCVRKKKQEYLCMCIVYLLIL